MEALILMSLLTLAISLFCARPQHNRAAVLDLEDPVFPRDPKLPADLLRDYPLPETECGACMRGGNGGIFDEYASPHTCPARESTEVGS